ncbi:hypothetical protein B7C51_19280 [Paenibacillus larvae subsp. pulvifaciens]|uniref:HNH endonuclease n=1 Tax=Paenibacillus larvae subsp. pulvifaciens TaxID=1477 RepID=A0A1V0UWM4_9BACL|nr:hypothetical protein [Paenibacillus larvae]ARF67060.1 hypothetical protein B7C51_03395 [Paenibacillus larvae subsp. pulvifaciens]ARF69501.1 hypothetical protein B7C51_19280 [Paenibacillus larvae subsp. pulvifaciens]
MKFEYRPYSKAQQVRSKRVKLTQKQMGDISPSVDAELKARSQGVCEFCGAARATERAHITGRKQIDHKTEVTDLLHTCTECHRWLDGTVEGIRARRCMAMLMKARE